MPCPLREAARRFGDSPALIAEDRVLSFREWDAAADALGAPLADLAPLSRVGIQGPDTLAAAILLPAAWRRGLTVALLSARLPTLDPLAGLLRLDRLLQGDAIPAPNAASRPSHALPDLATLLLTSGSSGLPKVVAHDLAAHEASAAASHALAPFRPGDVWLRALSLHHVGGLSLLFRAMHGGGAVAFPPAGLPLAAAIERFRVTHLSLVATQLSRLLSGPAPAGLRAVLVGGGPTPPELLAAGLAAGLPLQATYGMTELASQVATAPLDAPRERLGGAPPLPGYAVRVSSAGEILVKGPGLMRGYLRESGLDPATDADGWYATGDTGALSASGWLTITGRRDRMFISGGENVHPETIEQALLACPGVAAAAVVPLPHPTWGMRPAAFVLSTASEADIRAWLAARLPRFLHPDRILPWPEGTPEGKPPYADLARRAAEMAK